MLDLVPPSSPNPSTNSSRSKSVRRAAHSARSSSREPVTFEWKPPARLRRPIREELRRQRQRRRQHQAVVRFSRRPLVTTLPTKRSTSNKRRSPETLPGAEQNTGDVHRLADPRALMSMPPYAGAFVRGKAPVKRSIKNVRPKATPLTVTKDKQPKARKVSLKQVPVMGERDVPFQWQETKDTTKKEEIKEDMYVQAPSRRFALPLHFSFLPKLKDKDQAKQVGTPSKKKLLPAKLTSLF